MVAVGQLCRESYSVETRSQWAGKDDEVLVLLLVVLLLDETGTTRDYRRERLCKLVCFRCICMLHAALYTLLALCSCGRAEDGKGAAGEGWRLHTARLTVQDEGGDM